VVSSESGSLVVWAKRVFVLPTMLWLNLEVIILEVIMWKSVGCALFMVASVNGFAAQVQGGVCFPQSAAEIVTFMQQGQCGDKTAANTDEWQSKDLNTEDKGIEIAPDRAAVLFEFNSSALSSSFYRLLDEWGTALKLMPSTSFVIQGHTDNIGAESYNLELSQRRAQEVFSYLVTRHGIEARRLLVQGLGKSSPLKGSVAMQTDEERYWNRRVEFLKH